MPSSVISLACACLLFCNPDRATATLAELVVLEAADASPLPCRIHLEDASGRPVKPPALPFWKDHFVCDGRATLQLRPGAYHYAIERGPEYTSLTGRFEIAEGPLRLTNRLARLAHLAGDGWWSGDTHVHRSLADIELLMRAEDLHVAGVQTWWNNTNPWQTNALPSDSIIHFDGDRFYDLMSGEDERGGGALLYFGLKQPLPISNSKREFPSAAKFLKMARQHDRVWVDVEKPFWWDAPVWLASGLVDSVGIAHNHMHRGGVMDNEAWGRSRDVARYPGPHGNGLWTQAIYYHVLNCGLRIPPSAGSASGVLPNPVGYNRAYVQLDGELTYQKWWEGLRAGRVFVSNGPLLRCRANGHWPGYVFKGKGPLQIQLQAQLDSRDPVRAIELVRDGRVEQITSSQTITIQESGWFLVRVIADATNTFRFASTGPWYVEVGDQPRPVRRESAQFFLDWVRERMATLKLDNGPEREEVMQPLREAERGWQTKLAQASRADSRPPTDEADLRYWLENMVVFHRFTPEEVIAATGLSPAEVSDGLRKFDLTNKTAPARAPGEPLRVLPYPGGRHPRVGFLEGAIMPQRETKVSVFTPWDTAAYVVVDVPEAIFSNLGLTYLAHSHIPTIWDAQGVKLPQLEWNRHTDGTLDAERTLPNGIAFGSRVMPAADAVRMELWLRNGTRDKLTDLRVQNCVMLKGAPGFAVQTLTNKLFRAPYATVHSEPGRRWIINACDPCDRCWGNEKVPCLHADPKFPDCPPGETVRLRGWLSFYEGADIESELKRIDETGWRERAPVKRIKASH